MEWYRPTSPRCRKTMRFAFCVDVANSSDWCRQQTVPGRIRAVVVCIEEVDRTNIVGHFHLPLWPDLTTYVAVDDQGKYAGQLGKA